MAEYALCHAEEVKVGDTIVFDNDMDQHRWNVLEVDVEADGWTHIMLDDGLSAPGEATVKSSALVHIRV
jgi:hypothetical protein